MAKTVDDLTELWRNLRLDDVICVDALSLLRHTLVWPFRLLSGGANIGPRIRGFVGISPLRSLLLRTLPPSEDGAIAGVAGNISRCTPKAVALTTLNYSTGQTVTWVDRCAIETWERPLRRSVRTKLTVDHVMASASLPIAFPAVRLGKSWHGDGGIRLASPFSPALHLGAQRILILKRRYARGEIPRETI